MTQTLLAKPVVEAATARLIAQAQHWRKRGVVPALKVLLVGDHPPSLLYTRNKKKFIESVGGQCEIIHLPQNTSEGDFLAAARKIADDPQVHGCFVQLPLPPQLKSVDVATLFPAKKDVDGFHPNNLRALLAGDAANALKPCTPKGIMQLLQHYGFNPAGKRAVVIGRSMIVGKPMAMMLSNANATVSLCHSHTSDIAAFTRQAQLIVVAVGQKDFLKATHLGDNMPWIIDVGQNVADDSLSGDVAPECAPLVGALTPVPGGVGPMTICSLAENLFQAVELCMESNS